MVVASQVFCVRIDTHKSKIAARIGPRRLLKARGVCVCFPISEPQLQFARSAKVVSGLARCGEIGFIPTHL